ncbi:hypothetical protein [Streptomyces sp. NPDC059092]|uniref:hypothetical protein n=1 Tax=Streptomyces sp. NPDC059092 TaxID=3346725 RepID=UPI0036A60A3A
MPVEYSGESTHDSRGQREGDCCESARPVADPIEVGHLPVELAAALLHQETEFVLGQGRHISGVGLGFSERGHRVPGVKQGCAVVEVEAGFGESPSDGSHSSPSQPAGHAVGDL